MGADGTPPGGARPAAVAAIVDSVLRSPATLGEGRLVCVDGPAGSGKTTLAAALAGAFRAALGPQAVALVHMDDVYAGWDGLAEGMRTVADDLVAPLRVGRPGRYRRFDWHRGRRAEEHVVEPCPVLIAEGVGSGQASYAGAVTVLVWVEAAADIRLERGLERDGEALRDRWLVWRVDEDAMFARERTRERADVTVDGTGEGWSL